MNGNLSSPRARRRASDAMAAHDRLPPRLRQWAAGACLPWSAASLLRLWHRAMSESRCPLAALGRLQQAENRALAREARQIWGPGHPARHLG